MPDEPNNQVERTTFRCELWRAAATGVVETAGSTFLFLIAVAHFHAGANAKTLIGAGGNCGLVLTPLVVFLVAARNWRTARAGAALCLIGALGFAAAAAVPTLPVFVGGSMLALICSASFVPLMTQIYQENYPEARRGRLFSNAVMVRIGTVIAFGYAAGELLQKNIANFPVLLGTFCASLLLAAVCLARCPSRPLPPEARTSPFQGLRHVRNDALFRQMLISWMLMGLANLMMVMLRVEYMANAKYGPAFSPREIAMLTILVPNVARMMLSPVWGRLFDRMNFLTMRIILNVGFAVGALAFFAGRDMPGMVLGAIVLGISNAGGDVAWSLWVTKLAKPEQVAEYMSVHTFLTGLRGILAPVLAFELIEVLSFQFVSGIGAGLILLASLILIPELRSARVAARAPKPEVPAPLAEEVSG
ncbi:MAG TPA: MFS transporter [Planctomycetota bacterium]